MCNFLLLLRLKFTAYDLIEKLTIYLVYYFILKVKHCEEMRKTKIDFAGNMGIISTLFEMMIIYATKLTGKFW
jgi:hypothetical protein